MKKFAFVLVVVLLASMFAVAQEEKASVFGGWQYTNLDLKKDQTGMDRQSAPKGWDADVAFKAAKNFYIVGDFSGAYKNLDSFTDGEVTVTPNVKVHSFLGGARFVANAGKVSPFVEGLVGIAHTTVGDSVEGVTGSVSNNGLAFGFGGGLDVKAGKHVSIRLAKFDYIMSRVKFEANDLDLTMDTQTLNHFRIATGVVFTF